MPEHTPAPTPHRAIYGFAFYIFFLTLYTLYVFWALLPLKEWGLTYLPDKYFAIMLPMLVLMGFVFFLFFVYPGINMTLTANIDEIRSIVDPTLVLKDKSREFKSWQQLKTELQRSTPSRPKWSPIKNCEDCKGEHTPSCMKPITTVRFVDLKEMTNLYFN